MWAYCACSINVVVARCRQVCTLLFVVETAGIVFHNHVDCYLAFDPGSCCGCCLHCLCHVASLLLMLCCYRSCCFRIGLLSVLLVLFVLIIVVLWYSLSIVIIFEMILTYCETCYRVSQQAKMPFVCWWPFAKLHCFSWVCLCCRVFSSVPCCVFP